MPVICLPGDGRQSYAAVVGGELGAELCPILLGGSAGGALNAAVELERVRLARIIDAEDETADGALAAVVLGEGLHAGGGVQAHHGVGRREAGWGATARRHWSVEAEVVGCCRRLVVAVDPCGRPIPCEARCPPWLAGLHLAGLLHRGLPVRLTVPRTK